MGQVTARKLRASCHELRACLNCLQPFGLALLDQRLHWL